MKPTKLFGVIVLLFGLTGLQAACDKKPEKKEDQSADLGFKVIPAGENPARAPGPKGTMIELANTEVKIVLVRPGGPADLNGFMADDVILAAAGKEVHTEEQLAEIIAKNKDKKIIVELWRGVLAAVPFVDVVTTMLDDSIPLTTGEYDEWGNLNVKQYYD